MRGFAFLCAAGLTALAPSAQAAFVISSDATHNVSCSGGTCTSTGSSAVLNAGELMNTLATTNVTLVSESQAKDIYFNAAVSWSSTRTLTVSSYRAIRFNRSLSDDGLNRLTISVNGGAGDLRPGFITFAGVAHLTLTDPHALLTMNSQPYTLVDCLSALSAAATAKPDGHFALTGSCDAGPDGAYPTSPVNATFTGVFEGFNNTISNLHIADTTPSQRVGLFSLMSGYGFLENLRLAHVNIQASHDSQVGAVAGLGVATGIHVGGRISAGANSYVGGVLGWGDADHSVSSTAVTGGDDSTVGGIVGNGRVSYSISSGAVRTGDQRGNSIYTAAGGVLGHGFPASVVFSSARGPVSAGDAHGGATFAGGLVGVLNSGEIGNSFATGNVSGGVGAYVGGLVGYADANVHGSYATGDVTGGTASYAGGLEGGCYNTSVENYALGKVTGGDTSKTGGFAGAMFCSNTTSYSIGLVSGGANATLGGYVGFSEASPHTVYWDITTSGTRTGVGDCEGQCDVVGLKNKQLKAQLPAGFDPAIWGQSATINHGLPYLLALPPR